ISTEEATPGMSVKVAVLYDLQIMRGTEFKYLFDRREGATGTLQEPILGWRSERWIVKHDGSDELAAYCLSELELTNQTEKK
ncbi:MAG: hypothetical protein JWN49_442, partial [Parcubacteria group bacterium]|nr:hypothetical protein [Parcubacteria group bacterium]